MLYESFCSQVTVLRTALEGEEPMDVPVPMDADSSRKLLISSVGCIYVVSAGKFGHEWFDILPIHHRVSSCYTFICRRRGAAGYQGEHLQWRTMYGFVYVLSDSLLLSAIFYFAGCHCLLDRYVVSGAWNWREFLGGLCTVNKAVAIW